jgi:hypothetical protein
VRTHLAGLLADDRTRQGRVPEAVIRRASERWEVPTLLEAHRVDMILR